MVVDDEKYVAKTIQRTLTSEGYDVQIATSGPEALKFLEGKEVSLVISDYRMPNMNGVDFLQKVRDGWKDTVRIMITAYNDINIVVEAVNKVEVYRFICKPWKCEELSQIIDGAIAFYDLVKENKRLSELTTQQNEKLKYWSQNLTEKVKEQAGYIRSMFLSSIESLVNALEAKDKYTEGHSHRVSKIATSVAEIIPLENEEVERIRLAGLLHDIGKIGIQESILNKPGNLTSEELDHIREHPVISERILNPVFDDKEVVRIIRHHHEFYDGNGYPDGIKGESIPIGARILSVVDAFDAITTARPYLDARPVDAALVEIKGCAGTQFDPIVVNAFLKYVENRAKK